MDSKIKTCVIGSYPIKVDTMEIMREYFNGNLVSWKKYIKQAVNDMINAGIDIVSDGQTKDPFIQIFTRNLKGCRLRARTEITGKIEYDKPLTVNDQEYVKNLIPNNKELIGNITFANFTVLRMAITQRITNSSKYLFNFRVESSYVKPLFEKGMEVFLRILSIVEFSKSRYLFIDSSAFIKSFAHSHRISFTLLSLSFSI